MRSCNSRPSNSDLSMSLGYRKPPKNGQFKKGQSGNSKGRPKRPSQPVSTAIADQSSLAFGWRRRRHTLSQIP
jgi:Family of unknown function (DUF5681)